MVLLLVSTLKDRFPFFIFIFTAVLFLNIFCEFSIAVFQSDGFDHGYLTKCHLLGIYDKKE